MTCRVLVTGSRDWADETVIAEALASQLEECLSRDEDPILLHGGCPTGADAIAEKIWKDAWGLPVEPPYKADWRSYGPAAGPMRNQAMVDTKPDVCLAFIGKCTSPRCKQRDPHDSHGASGCADMAEKADILVKRYFG